MFGANKNKAKNAKVSPAEEKLTGPNFVRVARTKQVRPGQLFEAQAGKIPLALTNVDGTFYAFAAYCPHQEWPLWSGSMQGELVRCFSHRWLFNVRTGENIEPGGIPVCLTTYPVRIENDEIWVDVSQKT